MRAEEAWVSVTVHCTFTRLMAEGNDSRSMRHKKKVKEKGTPKGKKNSDRIKERGLQKVIHGDDGRAKHVQSASSIRGQPSKLSFGNRQVPPTTAFEKKSVTKKGG